MKNSAHRVRVKSFVWKSLGNQIKKEDSGQSMVEVALTFPVLFVILLGAIEFGRLSFAAIEVSNAARAGVAYGSLSLVNAADINGMQNAATQDGSDITGWKTVGLTATATEVCKCSDGTPTTCPTSATDCKSPARALIYVQVRTTATIDPLFYVPGLPRSYVLNGYSIMRSPQ